MALVVFLRGVNVGGHRSFRPTTLAEQLKHLDAVNIGAAGTFVIRQPICSSVVCFIPCWAAPHFRPPRIASQAKLT